MKRPATRQRDIQKHLMRSLGRALVVSERLTTTLTRAKTLRPIVEQWITLAKRANTGEAPQRLSHERRLRSEVQLDPVLRKLVDDLAKRSEKRQGGYTRILKLGYRAGDAAPKALIEFVDKPAAKLAAKKDEKPVPAITKKPAIAKAGK